MEKEALEGLTKKALADLAREKGLTGFSALSKQELVDALVALEKPKARKSAKPAEKTAPAEETVAAAKGSKTKTVAKAKPAIADAQVPAAEPEKVEAVAAKSAKPAKGKNSAESSESAGSAETVKAAESKKPPAKSAAGKKAETADAINADAKAQRAKTAKTKKSEAGTVKSGAKGKPAARATPKFQPAEAFLTDEQDELDLTVGEELGRTAEGPKFKKTAKVDDLLDVDTALGELPPTYDENRAVLLVRDPQWAYAYWDISKALAETAATKGDFRQILRVQELSGHYGAPAYFFDVQVPRHARSWYLKLPGDGRRYRIELGLHHRDGSYTAVVASNAIEMPSAKPSPVVADKFVTLPLPEEAPAFQPQSQEQTHLPPVAEWMVSPETARNPAPMPPPPAPVAGQPAPSRAEPLSIPGGGWEEAEVRPWKNPWSASHPLSPELRPGAPGMSGPVSSDVVTSWGFAPGASEELQQKPRQKDFWLVADAELIVYGATEPDAKVTLRGEKVELRPDGTFSFHFYLPEGVHPIPIRALNADEDDERMITITVTRQTIGDGKTNLRRVH